MPGLDGMRALAVLAVIAYHLQISWAPGGLLGVGVLFVLSGYLITDIILNKHKRHRRINLKQFWMHRARRLLPALWLLLMVVAAWVLICDPSEVAAVRQDVLAAFFYVSNWWYIFHHVSYFAQYGPPSPLTNLWSLAVEEQFYLIWPLLLVLGLRATSKRWLLVAGVVILALGSAAAMALLYHPGANPNRVYYGTDTRAFGLLIGAALAFVWPSHHLPQLSRRQRVLLEVAGGAGLLVFLAMTGFTNEYETFLYRGGMALLALFSAMTVAAVAYPGTIIGKVLGIKPLRWLGVRSYGIYLWHYPVIVLTTPLGSGFAPWRALWQVSASIILAALSWHFIEDPIRHRRYDAFFAALWHPKEWRRLPWGVPLATAGILGVLALEIAGLSAASPGKALAASPAEVSQIQPMALSAGPSQTLLGNRAVSEHPGSSLVPPSAHSPLAPSEEPAPPHSAVTSSSSPASSSAPLSTTALQAAVTGQGVTIIGDSIMIDAAPYLRQMLPGVTISAQIGRQFIQAPAVLSQLASEGLLGHIVVIELGTNGPFTLQQFDGVVQSLGARQILFINTRVPRPWQDVVNSTLQQGVRGFSNVRLLNWYQDSAGKNSYFYPDDVHLNPQGAQYFASLLTHAVSVLEQKTPLS
jgi:peptidoglycan/LPS O-acetylase OafA/YrhL